MPIAAHIADSGWKPAGYYGHAREEMLAFIPPGVNRVLEVGCARGEFGAALKRASGAEVWGIESCRSAAEEAAGKIDKVIVGDIQDEHLPLPESYFDCAVFNDVLEHLQYPWTVLSRLKSNLASGGLVVASIPNVRYWPNLRKLLFRGTWRYVDEGIMDKTHLRFFTKSSIAEMFESAGYDLQVIRGIRTSRLSLGWRALNLLLLNYLEDMRHVQFACVARKRGG